MTFHERMKQLWCEHVVVIDDVKRIAPLKVEAKCRKCGKILTGQYALSLNCELVQVKRPL